MKLDSDGSLEARDRVVATVERFMSEDGYERQQAVNAAAMVHGLGKHVVGRLYSDHLKSVTR